MNSEPWRDEKYQKHSLRACLLSEFFCSAFFVFCGTAYNTMDIIVGGFGAGVPIAWGLCLIFTVQLGHRISGSHVNPAVSIMFCIFKEISINRCILYSIVQIAGSFVGAAMTYLVYYDLIDNYDGGIRSVHGAKRTAHIFATYPKDYLTIRGGLVDQISTTAMLVIIVRSITKRRHGVPQWFQPFLLGLGLCILAVGFAENCQCAINPARDLGPRIFTLVAGYGWGVFSYRNYKWFWVPIIGPCVGAIIGAFLYKYFIGNFISELPEKENECKRCCEESERRDTKILTVY
uniref:Aquaporin n=1 Tax=Panagrolaimus sp. ES5 TaxID=591445 RepID=A0AC34EZM0_9BILA